MESVGLERLQLSDITPDSRNIFIIGIIIAKQEPRKFDDTKNAEAKRDRGVWNFTLRDSRVCYINATCWASKESVFSVNNKFHMGDVVTILNPQIVIRKLNDPGESYRPKVTSPYALILNEDLEQKITNYEGNCQPFQELLHLPTKPIAGAYTLADIHNRKHKIEGVDLLGIIRDTGKIRIINTRNGTERQVREITILDQTSPSLRITIWDPDLIIRACTWKVFSTILFITDVRCEWSEFIRSMAATLTSSTVVTEDPVSMETENLKKYMKENPIRSRSVVNRVARSIPNVSIIRNVMNVQQVQDKITNIMLSANRTAEEQQFTALIYAMVTHLDLDGPSRQISTRCSHCDTVIMNSSMCTNTDCPIGLGQEKEDPVTSFDLQVMLSDQTGSLRNCRLNGSTAETVLNCSVDKFLTLDEDEKEKLKWKLLLEHCAIRILVICGGFRNAIISILSCDLVSPLEVANRLPHS